MNKLMTQDFERVLIKRAGEKNGDGVDSGRSREMNQTLDRERV